MTQQKGSDFEREVREVLLTLVHRELRRSGQTENRNETSPLLSDRNFWTLAGGLILFGLGRSYALLTI